MGNPYISAGKAAELAGVSGGTISKALTSGKLSYVSKDKSGYQIDPAEVVRVFPPKPSVQELGEGSERGFEPLETLRERLSEKDQIIKDLRELVEDTRNDRDEWRKQAQTLALSDQRAKPEPVPAPVAPAPQPETPALPENRPAERVGWFVRLFGSGKA
jgi:hypothetical protein